MLRRARTMIFMVLCVFLFVQPLAFAYAADDVFESSDGGDFSYKVIYGPSAPTIASTTKQVQVYAPNNFEAALIVLGYGNDSRVTDDVKAYLSNQSTGGTFYDFAQGFTNNNTSWGNPLMFQNLGMSSALSTNNSLYGAENVWSSEYDMTMYDGAKQRVQDVIDGNVGGSGGGSGSGGETSQDYIYFSYDTYLKAFSSSWYGCVLSTDGKYYSNHLKEVYNTQTSKWEVVEGDGSSAVNNLILGQPFTVRVPKDLISNLPEDVSNMSIMVKLRQNGQLLVTLYNNSTYSYNNNTQYNTNQYVSNLNATIGTDELSFNPTGDYYYSYDGSTLTLSKSDSVTRVFTLRSYNTNMSADVERVILPYSDGTGLTPPVPPTNWPENPTVTPTVPPEVPNPTSPTIPTQPPEPVNPTSPTYPTIVYEPDVTYVTADLSAILDALNAHCKHLQDALHRECSNLWTNVSTLLSNQFSTTRNFLHTQFDWLIDSIDEEFDDFELYLKTLFEWLADQMSFTFTAGGYDDNTVVSWLKKIYSKLGTGTTTRPVDPTVDPFGIWDWLTRLFADFISNLLAIGANELADVTDAVEDLVHKFPFSIPWDIAALLGLLVSPAVTPQFEIPQYALTSSGLSQVGTYSINLQDYNSVWDGVRLIEKIGFVIFLAWNTTHFLDIFNKGGGKVTS